MVSVVCSIFRESVQCPPSRLPLRYEQHGYLKVLGVLDNPGFQPQVNGPKRGSGVPGDFMLAVCAPAVEFALRHALQA